MRQIEGTLSAELEAHVGMRSVDKAEPFKVSTYRQLMSHIAQLAYLNKDFLLFFRGQADDFKNRAGSSTFYPNIYRDDYLPSREVFYRYEMLNQASKLLVEMFEHQNITGYREIKRKKYIQWSILQHYEVCRTPLLDFTHSVRVACSFAQMNNSGPVAYISVFALPYITNRISINSEHDLVNIRLLSICPPDAMRPYYQEGYLVGTEDITTDYESKTELDFKNRLVAKFEIPNTTKFWGRGFSKIPESVLYPKGDKIQKLCDELKVTLEQSLQPGGLGEFLKGWALLEEQLQDRARKFHSRHFSAREAITTLQKQGSLPKKFAYELDGIRRLRNQIVHRPTTISPGELQAGVDSLRNVLAMLQRNF